MSRDYWETVLVRKFPGNKDITVGPLEDVQWSSTNQRQIFVKQGTRRSKNHRVYVCFYDSTCIHMQPTASWCNLAVHCRLFSM